MSSAPQRQDSLNAQLRDLREIARKNGMYDAVDLLTGILAAPRQSGDGQMRKAILEINANAIAGQSGSALQALSALETISRLSSRAISTGNEH